MGFTTVWVGKIEITPPMPEPVRVQVATLGRVDRGPGEPHDHLGWISDETGSALVWDGEEKFHSGAEWLRLLFDSVLRDHRGHGTVIGLGSGEAFVYDAQRVDVDGRNVRHRWYDIPYLGNEIEVPEGVDEDEFLDEFADLASMMWHLDPSVRADHSGPDVHAAARDLEHFLSHVQLEACGEVEGFLVDLVDLLDDPGPLRAVLSRHQV